QPFLALSFFISSLLPLAAILFFQTAPFLARRKPQRFSSFFGLNPRANAKPRAVPGVFVSRGGGELLCNLV
ncbi:MAG: hypothetical protein ACOC0K_01230, partial [bacterium]